MKKQLRLYDVYRTAITGDRSAIRGIDSYDVSRDATVLQVHCDQAISASKDTYFAKNEQELRHHITQINKVLGNCRKPGRKKK